ncbi:hypothetical protein P9112_012663 [Eukaryota sp. TZLM1-RC]
MSVSGALQPVFSVCELLSNNPLRLNKRQTIFTLLECAQLLFFVIVPHAVLLNSQNDSLYPFNFLKYLRYSLLQDIWSSNLSLASFLIFLCAILCGTIIYLSFIVGQSLTPFSSPTFFTKLLQFSAWLICRPLFIPLSMLFLSQIFFTNGHRLHFPDDPLTFSPVVVTAILALLGLFLYSFLYHFLVHNDDLMSKKWFACCNTSPFIYLYFIKIVTVIMFTLFYGRYRHEARLALLALSFYGAFKIWSRMPFFYFLPNAGFIMLFFTISFSTFFGFIHGLVPNWEFGNYFPLFGCVFGVLFSIIISYLLYKRFRFYVPVRTPFELSCLEHSCSDVKLKERKTKQLTAKKDKKIVKINDSESCFSDQISEFDAPFEIELQTRFLMYRPWRHWREYFDSITDAKNHALDTAETIFDHGCDLFGSDPWLILDYSRFVLYRRSDTKYVLLQIHALTNGNITHSLGVRFALFCLHTRSRRLNALAAVDEAPDDTQHASFGSLDSYGSAGSSLASFNSTGGSSSTRAHRFHLNCLKNLALFWLGMMPKSFAITKISSYTYEAITSQRSALRLYGKVIAADSRSSGTTDAVSQETLTTLKSYSSFLSEVCHEDNLADEAAALAEYDVRDQDFDHSDSEREGAVTFDTDTKQTPVDIGNALAGVILTPEQLETKKKEASANTFSYNNDLIKQLWSGVGNVVFRRFPITIPDCFEIPNKDRKVRYGLPSKKRFNMAMVLLFFSFLFLFIGYSFINSLVTGGYNQEVYDHHLGRSTAASRISSVTLELESLIQNNAGSELIIQANSLLTSLYQSLIEHQSFIVGNSRFGLTSSLSLSVLNTRTSSSPLYPPSLRLESELDMVASVAASALLLSSRIGSNYGEELAGLEMFGGNMTEFQAKVVKEIDYLSDNHSNSDDFEPAISDLINYSQILSDALISIEIFETLGLYEVYSNVKLFVTFTCVFLLLLGVFYLMKYIITSQKVVNITRNEIFHTLSNELPSVIVELLASRYKQALVSLPGGKSIAMDLAKVPEDGVDTSQDGREFQSTVKFSEFEESLGNESSSYIGPASVDLIDHWAGSGEGGFVIDELANNDPAYTEYLSKCEMSLLKSSGIKKVRKSTKLLLLIVVVLLISTTVLLFSFSNFYSKQHLFSDFSNYGVDPTNRIGLVPETYLPQSSKPLNHILYKEASLSEFNVFANTLRSSILGPQGYLLLLTRNITITPHYLDDFHQFFEQRSLLTRMKRSISFAGSHLVSDPVSNQLPVGLRKSLESWVTAQHTCKVAVLLSQYLIDEEVINTLTSLDFGNFGSIYSKFENFEYNVTTEPHYTRDLIQFPHRPTYSDLQSDSSKNTEDLSNLIEGLVTDDKFLLEFNTIIDSLSDTFDLLLTSYDSTVDDTCQSHITRFVFIQFFLVVLTIGFLFAFFHVFRHFTKLLPLLKIGPACVHVNQSKLIRKQYRHQRFISILGLILSIVFSLGILLTFNQSRVLATCPLKNSNIAEVHSLIQNLNDFSRDVSDLAFYSRLYVNRDLHSGLVDDVIEAHNSAQKSAESLINSPDFSQEVLENPDVFGLFELVTAKIQTIQDSFYYLSTQLIVSSFLRAETFISSHLEKFQKLEIDYDFSKIPHYLNIPENSLLLTSADSDLNLSTDDKQKLMIEVISSESITYLLDKILFEISSICSHLSLQIPLIYDSFSTIFSFNLFQMIMLLSLSGTPFLLFFYLCSRSLYPDNYVKPAFSMWRFAVNVLSLKKVKLTSFILAFLLIIAFALVGVFSFNSSKAFSNYSKSMLALNVMAVEASNSYSASFADDIHSIEAKTLSLNRLINAQESLLVGGVVDGVEIVGLPAELIQRNFQHFSDFQSNFHLFQTNLAHETFFDVSQLALDFFDNLNELTETIHQFHNNSLESMETMRFTIFVIALLVLFVCFLILKKWVVKKILIEQRFNQLILSVVPIQVLRQVPALSLLTYLTLD